MLCNTHISGHTESRNKAVTLSAEPALFRQLLLAALFTLACLPAVLASGTWADDYYVLIFLGKESHEPDTAEDAGRQAGQPDSHQNETVIGAKRFRLNSKLSTELQLYINNISMPSRYGSPVATQSSFSAMHIEPDQQPLPYSRPH